MARAYPKSWEKLVKHAMIDNDLSVERLAHEIGRTRAYVSAVIHGRVVSDSVVADICNLLEVDDPDTMNDERNLIQ